jgi:hypothetical protein
MNRIDLTKLTIRAALTRAAALGTLLLPLLLAACAGGDGGGGAVPGY